MNTPKRLRKLQQENKMLIWDEKEKKAETGVASRDAPTRVLLRWATQVVPGCLRLVASTSLNWPVAQLFPQWLGAARRHNAATRGKR